MTYVPQLVRSGLRLTRSLTDDLKVSCIWSSDQQAQIGDLLLETAAANS